MSKWALRSKRWTIHSFALLGWATWAIRAWSLIFGEGPERIAHGHSFLVSKLSNLLTLLIFGDYLSDLLTSLIIKREWVNRSVFFKHTKNIQKNTILVKFFWANCSFFVSNRANERFAHFLIYHERPEQITHGRSFVMSDLSDLLTVAPLSWAIWANHSQSLIWFEQSEQMSELAMSKLANSQPWVKYPPPLSSIWLQNDNWQSFLSIVVQISGSTESAVQQKYWGHHITCCAQICTHFSLLQDSEWVSEGVVKTDFLFRW